MHGDRRRLDQGGMLEQHVLRQGDQRVGRDVPAFLERARAVDAEQREIVTDMGVTRLAGRAGAIPAQRHDCHRITDAPTLNLVADGRDRSAHLVTDDLRRRYPGVQVAMQDVQVGAAQPGVGHGYLDLSGSWRVGVVLLDPNVAMACVMCGQHRLLQTSESWYGLSPARRNPHVSVGDQSSIGSKRALQRFREAFTSFESPEATRGHPGSYSTRMCLYGPTGTGVGSDRRMSDDAPHGSPPLPCDTDRSTKKGFPWRPLAPPKTL